MYDMHDSSDSDYDCSIRDDNYSSSSSSLDFNHYKNKRSMKDSGSFRTHGRKNIAIQKPWMSYVNKYSLLSNQQRESLDLFFLNNQVRLTRKNIRSIASELKISYKKIINYIYEKNYDHLLIKEGPEEKYIHDIKSIGRDLKQSWDVYQEVSKIFRNEMGIFYNYK